MIDGKQIAEIIDIYAKHGWKLRRVLLSEGLSKRLGDSASELFGTAERRESDIDAAWFSRSAKPGNETWEVRRLSADAFALCEVFSDEDDEGTREETMFEMEDRLRG